jgi:hypothetical protein
MSKRRKMAERNYAGINREKSAIARFYLAKKTKKPDRGLDY